MHYLAAKDAITTKSAMDHAGGGIMDEPVEIPIEDFIDLHTFQPRDVPGVIEEYLYQALQRKYRMVRIIHGRGIGVQREMVHSILSRHPGVRSFADAPDRGATVAELDV